MKQFKISTGKVNLLDELNPLMHELVEETNCITFVQWLVAQFPELDSSITWTLKDIRKMFNQKQWNMKLKEYRGSKLSVPTDENGEPLEGYLDKFKNSEQEVRDNLQMKQE